MLTFGLTDTDLMPVGQYKGTEMRKVPRSYLVWYADNVPVDRFNRDVHDYIEEKGIDNLKKEIWNG